MQGIDAGATLADRFRLTERLSEGTSAEVWLARDTERDYAVALKIARDGIDRAAFRAEWETLRALNHPQIVRVFDYVDEPVALFAQYYVDGPDLASIGSQPAAALLRPVALIARALHYLHSRGVAHGDINATNIVFDQGGAPFLIDFGCARRGEILVGLGGGTPAALSPERRESGEPGIADDRYALGVLIEELTASATDSESVDPRIRSLVAALTSARPDERPSADEVERVLSAIGVSPGPLPAAIVREVAARRPAAASQPRQDAVVAPTPVRRGGPASVPPPAASPKRGPGVSPAWVIGGAAALLLLFVALLTWLPERAGAPGEVEPLDADESPSGATEVPASEPDGGDGLDDEPIEFSEGRRDDSLRTGAVRLKSDTDRVLGELLTKQDVLEARAASRWAPKRYADALAAYERGDRFYLSKDYAQARDAYRETIGVFDTLLGEVDSRFDEVMARAARALDAGDAAAARRAYELALAITPGEPEATAGFERARNLNDVLALVDVGLDAERDGDYDAALAAFDKALDIDSLWQPARDGRDRVANLVAEQSFRQIMSDAFAALDEGRFERARRLFRQARSAKPGSPEAADGLLQVDQAARLAAIGAEQSKARQAEADEDWEAAAAAYEAMLKQDSNLTLARDGLANARARIALDRQLETYLSDPDRLADQTEMAAAAGLLTRLATIDPAGPRLSEQKERLARVLKRAAEPVPVVLQSDGLTEVAVYKVGRLGRFEARTLNLRPGVYTAVGTRSGYKDVRLEFRVEPEDPGKAIVVKTEEPI